MYFFDNSYYGYISQGLATNVTDIWYNHYEFGNYIFTNNPDGSFSVYYSPSSFSGNTSDIQNFTSQITREFCSVMQTKFNELRDDVTTAMKDGISEFPNIPPSEYGIGVYPANSEVYTNTNLLNPSFPSVYWDTKTSRCMSNSESNISDCCDSDNVVDYSSLMTQPLSDVKTIEEFEYYLTSELIDAKSRKVLSGYPTLRALYDRYINSSDYCPTRSSAFDYEQMDQFSHLIDNYWVDIVEQVIPATTIWGSVKIYGNTMFDQQKFQYKKGSLFTCTENCPDLDNVNACLFNLIETFYINTSDDCHTNVCYQKGYGNIDFLDDVSQMPTSDQIRSWGSNQCGCNYTNLNSVIASHTNAVTELPIKGDVIRANIEIFKQQTVEYSDDLMYGYCDGDSNVITPDSSLVSYASYPNEFMYLGKPVMLKINAGAKASIMEGWTASTDPTYGLTLEQIYSAHTDDFNYIRSVPDFASLPIIGNGGDIIRVHNGGYPYSQDYAWDPISNSWSIPMYDFIENEILTTRRDKITQFVKAKKSLILAMRPFTWSNYHLLLHPIKLWSLKNEPIITGNDIINSATDITPCSYVKTADPCVLSPFCGPYKHIYNAQC